MKAEKKKTNVNDSVEESILLRKFDIPVHNGIFELLIRLADATNGLSPERKSIILGESIKGVMERIRTFIVENGHTSLQEVLKILEKNI